MSHSDLQEQYGLEEQQIDILLQEDDAPLENISRRGHRVFFLTGFALVFLFIVFSITITLPQEVQLNFVLKGGSVEEVKRVGEPIFVHKLLVTTGDELPANTPLMVISSPGILQMISDVDRKRQLLKFQESTATDYLQKELEVYRTKGWSYREQVVELKKELTILKENRAAEIQAIEQQIAIHKNDLNRQEALFKEQVISQSQLEQAQLTVQQQEQDKRTALRAYVLSEQTLQQQLRLAQTGIQEINTTLALLEQKHALDREKLQQEVSIAEEQLKLTFGSNRIDGDRLMLLTETQGTVNMIREPETRIGAGEIVWRLETQNQAAYVYSEANSAQVGHLKEGQKVVMKFESFPYFYYGAKRGQITSIGDSPSDEGYYPINIQLNQKDDFKPELKKGMTGRASVLIEELTLAHLLYKMVARKVDGE
ncbi:MAG: HlyD family efflux transporter periplasmic adaptor subunit [Cytophagales bacterium]|nr:HlyD family efflux transporter periplasmic adaptor subunit [Cytophagales bacterium]